MIQQRVSNRKATQKNRGLEITAAPLQSLKKHGGLIRIICFITPKFKTLVLQARALT